MVLRALYLSRHCSVWHDADPHGPHAAPGREGDNVLPCTPSAQAVLAARQPKCAVCLQSPHAAVAQLRSAVSAFVRRPLACRQGPGTLYVGARRKPTKTKDGR